MLNLVRSVRDGLTVLLLGSSAVLLLAACEQDHVTPLPGLHVEVYEVGRAVVKRDEKFYGSVVPADLTRVAFRIPGKISHLAVQAGQRVIEGQMLAQIEDSIQRQVLADATARYKLSRRQLERAEDLYRRGSLTAAQRDQLQASYRLAEANLRLAEAALSYTLVKAPFEGTVAEVNKELYESVTAGETVVTVYRHDRTDVLVNIPDTLPAKIHQARDITNAQVQVLFSGSPTVYTMRYLKSSAARNPKTQAFQLWITMPAPDAPLPPGLPATVTADLQEAGFSTEGGLVVPLTALDAGAQEEVFQVWRLEAGLVQPVPVKVSRIIDNGAFCSGDLQEGDLIVNSGLARLSAGLPVTVRQDNRVESQGR